MADTTKQLILKIQADLENYNANIEKVIAQTNKLDSSFGQTAKGAENLWQKFMLGDLAASVVKKGFSEINDFVKDSVRAFLEAEQVDRRMTFALKMAGDATGSMAQEMKEFATEIQNTTGINDELVKGAVQLGLSMGIPIDKIKEVTKGAIGLSEAFGVDLGTAMKGVTSAMEGEFGLLGRYIPALKGAGDETQKMAILQKAMADGFQMTTDAAQTTSGQFKIFQAQLEDMKEEIGKELLLAFGSLIKEGFQWIISHKDDIVGAFKNIFDVVSFGAETFMVLAKAAKWVFDIFKNVGPPDAYLRGLAEVKYAEEQQIERLSKINAYRTVGMMGGYGRGFGMSEYFAKLRTEYKKTQETEEEYYDRMIPLWELEKKKFEERIKLQEEIYELIQKTTKKSPMLPEGMLMPGISETMEDFKKESEKDTLRKLTEKTTNETKKFTMNWREANDVIQFTNTCINELGNLLGALGIDLGDTGKEILDLAGDMGTLAASIATENIPGIVSGAVSVLGDLINLFKGDGIGQAIRRENEWMNLTEKQIEQLRTLAEELGDTHAATSEMLSEFIRDAEITDDNFEEWSFRVHEILSDFDRGKLKGKEFADAMGSAWDALTEKMKELKMPGITGGMADIIRDLRARGLEVKAISDFVMQSLTTDVGALGGYIKGAQTQDEFNCGLTYTMGLFKALQSEGKSFNEIMDLMGDQFDILLEKMTEGFTATGGISDLLKMRQFAKDNAGLMDQISSLTTLMKSFGDSVYMDKELFATFGASTLDVYNKLIGAGQSEKEALQWMAPLLAEQVWYAKQYGYAIDEQTQALIDKAKANDINLPDMQTEKDLLKSMKDALWELVDLFSNKIPTALGKTKTAFGDMAGAASDAAGAYGATGGYKPPWEGGGKIPPGEEPAQEGLHGIRRGPHKILIEPGMVERVDITPINRPGHRGGGGGVSLSMPMNINIYGSIQDKESWEKVGKIVFQDNFRGWTTELKKVLGL